jgi:glutathione reductase (NADPH)
VPYDYDIVVIGSGPAGQAVASECRSSGLRLAVVEEREYGGTCPLRGCDPKKVLVGAAEVIARAAGMRGKGIRSQNEIQWQDLIHFKKTFTDPIPAQMEKRLSEWGIDTYHGSARFSGKNALQSGEKNLTSRYVVIGSGAIPGKLEIEGGEHVISSDQFLDLEVLPETIAFVGGGYISFEFAHIAALAGCKAFILHRGPRPLKGFDPDLVQILVRASKKIGVEVHPNLPVRSVERREKRFGIRAGEKGEHSLEADLVVHGAGRVPDIQRLELEKAGVESSPRGVLVNEHLQSVSNPSVYAAGDAAATPYPLTPIANLEGKIVARNILSGNTVRTDYRGVPSVVFTFPPLASVGFGEEELRRKGIEYENKFAETSSWFESRRIGLEDSGMKILAEKNSRRILGVHLLGHHAEEVINVFALAIRLGLTTDDLGQIPWVYPSSVSEMGYLVG